ncbi:WXG100 family type VII secretion target [Nocardia sp. NPDC051756]|uniref:WXG100 family type VII secretion target n=1 Tax=Nocardia sp. NPDC051756 TaxID=3154751 RepID=UPI00343AA533
MTDEFHVDLDHLDQLVARLSGLAGFLRAHLAELDRKVADLQTGIWDGTAAAAYVEAHRQWAVGAQEFAEGVTEMSEAASRAHVHYTEAATLNLNMLRST